MVQTNPDTPEMVSPEKISHKMQIVDVRSLKDFEKGHVPGSIHIPFSELESRMAEIDLSKQVVFICQGGGKSKRAVKLWTEKGYAAVFVNGGYRDYLKAEL